MEFDGIVLTVDLITYPVFVAAGGQYAHGYRYRISFQEGTDMVARVVSVSGNKAGDVPRSWIDG